MRRFFCFFAALSLSACASPPTPSEILALTAAKDAAEQQVPLTPALRNSIAASVRAAKASKWNVVTNSPIQDAEISQLKVGLPYRTFNPDAAKLDPYYCVRATFPPSLSTGFLPTKATYKVTVLRTAQNQYAMKVFWNLDRPPLECVINATYEPFPELTQNLPQAGMQ